MLLQDARNLTAVGPEQCNSRSTTQDIEIEIMKMFKDPKETMNEVNEACENTV